MDGVIAANRQAVTISGYNQMLRSDVRLSIRLQWQ